MRVTTADQYFTLLLAVMAVVGGLLKIQKRWDTTNGILAGLVQQMKTLDDRNSREHADMDARHDRLEGRFNEHVGRHRRY